MVAAIEVIDSNGDNNRIVTRLSFRIAKGEASALAEPILQLQSNNLKDIIGKDSGINRMESRWWAVPTLLLRSYETVPILLPKA